MSRRRAFRPESLPILEDRVVPSTFFHTVNQDWDKVTSQVKSAARAVATKHDPNRAPGAEDLQARLGHTKLGLPVAASGAATPVKSNAVHAKYGPAAGLYVPGRSMSRTTFDDGTTQTIVGVVSHSHTITTTLQTITLRDGTVKTGSLTAVVNGPTTTYSETVGTIGSTAETITGTDTRAGHVVTFNRTVTLADNAGTQTIQGTLTTAGATTSVDQMVTLPNGQTEHVVQTSIRRPGRTYAVNTSTTAPDGTTTTVTSTRGERGPASTLPAGMDVF